jgi:D-amino-acid dehydrogenase
MRPLTPDGLPIIGRLPQRHNVFVASGHAMLGVTSALVTATLIADLLAAGEPGPTASPFDPGRFVRSHGT